MKASILYDAFNAGEFSPVMGARVRFDKYKNALALCENMIPLVQGGVTRRTGSMYVATAKRTDNVRMKAFKYSLTQNYMLEFGHNYIRFYRDRGQILSGGSPYEISTPYDQADIFQLKFTQSADVLYITHPSYYPRTLTRSGHTSWTLALYDNVDGPYFPINATTTTITPSATSGTVTLTASTAIFLSTHVGRWVRLRHGGSWGWAKISVFTDTTHVTAVIPTGGAFAGTTATDAWRMSVWDSVNGYPACSTFYEDRLCFGGQPAYPQRIDMTKVGDYTRFSPSDQDGTVTDDAAVSCNLNSNDVNAIRWLTDDEHGLIAGSTSAEWIIRPSTLQEALSPTNIKATRSTSHGSYNIEPVKTGKTILYLQRSGRKVRELSYVYEVDGFRSPDMTILANHVLKTGVAQLAYQQDPNSIVWGVRTDGQLVGLTYERDQDVLGWHRQILGGSFGSGNAKVMSCDVIPTPDASADEIWLVVKRTIDGNTVQYVEYITPSFNESEPEDTVNAFFVDSGLTYDGVAADTISGLDHLEGETVAVLADGAVHPDCLVSSGSITLNAEYSVVTIGLPYESNVKTLGIEAGSADGTSQGKTKRIHRMVIRLFNTVGLKFGPNENTLDVESFRTSEDLMDSPVALFTGDISFTWNGDYETQSQIYFRQDQPLPFTLLGIFPQLVTQDR